MNDFTHDVQDELYQEHILDHNQNPRNKGLLKKYSFTYKDGIFSCGDSIEIFVQVSQGREKTKQDGKHMDFSCIQQIRFQGAGCAISQSAASMLTEKVMGKQLDEIKKLGQDEVLEMMGIHVGATRMKCAMLSLRTLQKGIYLFLNETHENTPRS